MCNNIDDEPQDYYDHNGSLRLGSPSGMTHSIGRNGSTSGNVGTGSADPSTGCGGYNQPYTPRVTGVFASTSSTIIGTPYPVFGSQN